MKDIEQIERLSRDHAKIIQFMKEHNNLIDWDNPDITKEMLNLIWPAIPDVIQSYCETESYMLNTEFRK
jgi:hypothetical protein